MFYEYKKNNSSLKRKVTYKNMSQVKQTRAPNEKIVQNNLNIALLNVF